MEKQVLSWFRMIYNIKSNYKWLKSMTLLGYTTLQDVLLEVTSMHLFLKKMKGKKKVGNVQNPWTEQKDYIMQVMERQKSYMDWTALGCCCWNVRNRTRIPAALEKNTWLGSLQPPNLEKKLGLNCKTDSGFNLESLS